MCPQRCRDEVKEGISGLRAHHFIIHAHIKICILQMEDSETCVTVSIWAPVLELRRSSKKSEEMVENYTPT